MVLEGSSLERGISCALAPYHGNDVIVENDVSTKLRSFWMDHRLFDSRILRYNVLTIDNCEHFEDCKLSSHCLVVELPVGENVR